MAANDLTPSVLSVGIPLRDLDVATSRLAQADAVLTTLEALGIERDGAGDDFGIPQATVMSTLWAVRSLLGDARQALQRVAV